VERLEIRLNSADSSPLKQKPQLSWWSVTAQECLRRPLAGKAVSKIFLTNFYTSTHNLDGFSQHLDKN
jgi:hypothetical protein